MKTLITNLIIFSFLIKVSSGLQCYFGNYSVLTKSICSQHRSDFCAILKFKSGTFDNCGQETCTDLGCTDNEFCKEPGISSEHELYEMKFEINCCEKDLCNFENFESSAQSMNKIKLLYFFVFIVLLYISV